MVVLTLWLAAALVVPQAAEPTWSAVVAGAGETNCGIRSDHSLWCWGFNDDGQIGDGTTETRARPVRIGGATTWRMIAPTYSHTCGVRTDGSLWCWGRNVDGQLGLGADDGTRTSPARVGTATDWMSVSTGGDSTCGIRTDRSLWCWGENDDGELGDGTTDERRTPVRIGAATDWARVETDATTCGIRTTGTLWCWGSDYAGIAGGQAETAQTAPARVGTSSSWTSVGIGNGEICAVDSGLAWSDVTVGRDHACALRIGGQTWCWGANDSGQLGDGSFTERHSPVRVGDGTDWQSVSAGGSHTCALRTDRSLWCWGDNRATQLGVLTPVRRPVVTTP
jgi:alpha-tubulin suppressor-like RCC1 family protein